MAIIEVSIGIQASPAQVWAYMADIPRHPQWMTDIHSLEMTSAGTQGVGTSFRAVSRGPLHTRVVDDMVCTEWTEGEVLSVEHRGSVRGGGSFVVTPIELGVRVRRREEIRMPLGWLGELTFRLLFRRGLRRTFSQDLRNLKARVEGSS